MATVYHAISERLTGYYVGEMSPFAQKKRVPIAFDEADLTESSVFLPIRRSRMRRPFDCGPSLSNTSRRPHPFHIVHPKGRHLPAKVCLFLDHAAEGRAANSARRSEPPLP
jgi:hypothetical protein